MWPYTNHSEEEYNKSSVQTLTYSMSAGEHYIDVKYSKDDASAANNDTLQFKVSITLNETAPTYYGYDITNIQGDHTILVISSGGSDPAFWFKVDNNNWGEIQVWQKSSNGWVVVTDPAVIADISKFILSNGGS